MGILQRLYGGAQRFGKEVELAVLEGALEGVYGPLLMDTQEPPDIPYHDWRTIKQEIERLRAELGR